MQFEKTQYPSIYNYIKFAKSRANSKPRQIELLAAELNLMDLEEESDSEEVVTDQVDIV